MLVRDVTVEEGVREIHRVIGPESTTPDFEIIRKGLLAKAGRQPLEVANSSQPEKIWGLLSYKCKKLNFPYILKKPPATNTQTQLTDTLDCCPVSTAFNFDL